MCLAVPGKIIRIEGDDGYVDFGGVVRRANVSMVEAKVGDWAVVHAGFAIEVMDDKEAEETLKLWNEVLDSDKTCYR
ncbi:MAG: HypC/HybG/HupF family hydrogenase formation chaperone [Candidatus Methanoplasma sp.]|jgi:hydrogenase expression/formation protein HypC|nr:HypC/HybG/HupF family hydrogenase formation chaperone [Candidatus Methanoplasma sp.]